MMRKRFVVFGVLALVLALLMPSRAFAWDLIANGVWWRGNTSQGMYGACVHADNKYDAAAWLFSRGDPSMLSSEVRSKLSDPNYGGRFYEYAQTFSHMEDLTQYPEWLPAYVGVANLFVNGFGVGIFDVGFYTSNVSESLYSGAKIDFERVLAGEDLSGGSGGVATTIPEGDYYKIPLRSDYGAELPSQFVGKYAYISVDLMQDVYSFFSAPDYVSHGIRPYYCFRYSPYDSKYYFLFMGSSSVRVTNQNSYSFHNMVQPTGYQRTLLLSDGYFLYRGNSLTSALDWYFDGYYEVTNYVPLFMLSDNYSYPVVHWPTPDGDWPEPETPVAPTAPEIPTPTAPTVEPDPTPTEPTPTWPDITINIPVAPTVEVTPTGLDYTELLTRINDNLNTINSYTVSINSGLNSLRSDLVTEFESVEQGLRNIYQFLQHMDSMLERHCQHLRDALSDCTHHLELYLKELFEWLPQQLNYDAEFEYDDSGVIGWLKNIYYKLGGGTSAPNPITDSSGFFDWLLGLITGFLASLLAGLPGKVQELLSDLTDLTEYFPFSAPWDLYGLLLLFAHDPVIPVFTIPWGFGSGRSVDIVIDCTQWDGVMSVVRSVEKIIFAGGLAKLTFDMFRPTDVTGD